MAVRTGYVATEAVGDVLTKANFDKLPGGNIAYASIVANQAGITAQADITGLTVTVTVNTARRIRIMGFVNTSKDATAAACNIYIMEGATQLTAASNSYVATGVCGVCLFVDLSPTAASHTYKMQALSGSGAMTIVAASNQPGWLTVDDIGLAY